MASSNEKPGAEASLKEESSEFSQTTDTGTGEMPDAAGYFEGLRVTDPEKREKFGKAFIQILVAAIIFGGGLYLYWGKVERDKVVHALAVEARSTYLRDNYRDLIEAEQLLKEALELDARHRYSISTLGFINSLLMLDHGLNDRRQQALAYTSQAEERGAHLQERYGARASLLIDEGRAEDAEILLVEDVINKGGTGPAITGTLGLSQRMQGKRTLARGALQRASEAERSTPRYSYWIAQMYFDEEDHSNCASFIERALDVNPDHISTLVLRARNRIARDDNPEQAFKDLEELLQRTDRELSPRPKAFAKIGIAEYHNVEMDYEKAISYAEQALEIMTDISEAHLIRGMAMAGAGQEGALEEIRKSIDLSPHTARGYHQSAIALMKAEEFDSAREIMELWGENVTRNAAYHIAFGNLLLESDEIEDAKGHFETALELNPRTAEAHYQLGQIALNDESLEDERITKAIEHFNEAVRVRERYPEVYEAMGWIYLDQRHFADGLRQFVQAITYYQVTQTKSREELHELRAKIGEALERARQRQMARMWVQESRELIR